MFRTCLKPDATWLQFGQIAANNRTQIDTSLHLRRSCFGERDKIARVNWPLARRNGQLGFPER